MARRIVANHSSPSGPARDHVRNTIPVRIPRSLEAASQLVFRGPIGSPKKLPGAHRVDIDPAAVRSMRTVSGCGGYDFRNTISVEVTDLARNPSELIARRLAAPLSNHLYGLDKRRLKIGWHGQ